MISKGSLIAQGRWRLSRVKENARLRITYAMTPTAKLLIYYTKRDGEIVADALTFSIDDIFRTQVFLVVHVMFSDCTNNETVFFLV